jgi:hypothetical protein
MDTHHNRRMFLPGPTTAGHYQIERACANCHAPFAGVPSEKCLACHGEELTHADDSHPKSKFTDPRNAELLTRLDATRCVTCHREHVPGRTRPIGVTLPDDFCVTCHEDVGADRPSHDGLAFSTCAAGGCHNYHDNTALYEDFLVAQAGAPDFLARRTVPVRRPAPAGAVRLAADAAGHIGVDPSQLADLETTSHARAGVNCTGCHLPANGSGPAVAWLATPGPGECGSCHDAQFKGFLGGRHGMRLAADLGALTPALARHPMRESAADHRLSCSTCHPAHGFDTKRAAFEACITCHDDRHSRAYLGSPHHAAWLRETGGASPPGSGVSCATCHLPRAERRVGGETAVVVEHNQNANLRPNEKMLRSVCLNCHGLRFSLDALADAALVGANFTGRPARPVGAIEMATRRAAAPN